LPVTGRPKLFSRFVLNHLLPIPSIASHTRRDPERVKAILRAFHKSAKGADAHRQTEKELACSSGGAPSAQASLLAVVRDSRACAPVLRVFFRRATRVRK
jgi:hypothetical protein